MNNLLPFLIVLLLNLFLVSCQKTPAQQANTYENAEPFPVGSALVHLKVQNTLDKDSGVWINAEIMSVKGYGSDFGNPLSSNQVIQVQFPLIEDTEVFTIDMQLEGYIKPAPPIMGQDDRYYKMYDYIVK